MKKYEEILKKLKEGGFLNLSLKERRAVVKEEATRYQKVTKKEKGKMLDEFAKLTGYSRCYAAYALRIYWKKVAVCKNGIKTVFIGYDLYNGEGARVKRRNRERVYDEKTVNALIHL